MLIKGLEKVVNVKFSRNTHLIETSYDRLKSREIKRFLSNTGKILLKQEFSDNINIHEHKRYYYTFDNSLLFTESNSEYYTNLSTLNHNVWFLPCQHWRWYTAIRVRAKPCVHRFNYSRTLLQRSLRQGCGHS